MYRSIHNRKPRGICLFALNEELSEAKISLRFAGVELVRLRAVQRERRSHSTAAFQELEVELLEEGDYKVYEGYGFYGDTPLLVRFYMLRNEPRIVRYAALLTYKPRVLKGLIKRLEDLGWKRRFFFEIEARISKYL